MNQSSSYISSDPHDKKEKARTNIVKLVFLFYFLFIIEGALRKWFLPGLHKYLFFIKEPVVLLIYYFVAKNKLWPPKEKILSFAYFLCGFGFLYIAVQYISQYPKNTVLSLLFGWKVYFFYIPLAFIIGANFRARDLKRFIGVTLLIAIPMSFLCYKQIKSPPTAFVNLVGGGGTGYATIAGYTGEDTYYIGSHGEKRKYKVMGGEEQTVRVTGTFSYFHGWQIFLGSLIACIFIAWVLPKKDSPLEKKWLLVLATLAVGVAYASDVTRFPTFLAVFSGVCAIFSSFLTSDVNVKNRARFIIVALMVLGVLSSMRYLSKAHEVRNKRLEEDYIGWRTGRMFTDFIKDLRGYPKLGGGLGAGNPGGRALGATQDFTWPPPLQWYRYRKYEDEWTCVYSEAGLILGTMYLFFRLWLTIWLLMGAINATKRSNNPTPIIFWGFISSILLMWYLTKIGSVNAAGWLYCGILIAANQLGYEGFWSDKDPASREDEENGVKGLKDAEL